LNLIATFPPGLAEITVNGLHQWDRGRQLEIHSAELPAVIEVHFACAGMDEAVVRSCSAAGGVAVALIPDRCLEQSAPITAWIYEIDGSTSGMTTKKITLPVEARTRPNLAGDIPVDTSDKYTEAVGAMNQAAAEMSAKVNELKRLEWKSLNDLMGFDFFSQSNKEVSYTATLTAAQMAEYFPRGKVCLVRRTALMGNGQVVFSDVQMSCLVEGLGMINLVNPEMSILFDGNEITVYCLDEDALLPLVFKIDVAVLD
jgi:hypothetical protein